MGVASATTVPCAGYSPVHDASELVRPALSLLEPLAGTIRGEAAIRLPEVSHDLHRALVALHDIESMGPG